MNLLCEWVDYKSVKVESNVKTTTTFNFNLETNLISVDFCRFQENKQNEISKPKWLFSLQLDASHWYELPSFSSVNNTRPDVFLPGESLLTKVLEFTA